MSVRAELSLLRPPDPPGPEPARPADAGQRPCNGRAPGWDLDSGELGGGWRRARAACRACPVLAQCRRALLALYPRAGESLNPGQSPVLVTWAGISFGSTGRVLDDRGLRLLWTRTQRDRATDPAAA